jgi:hypothetical protein
MSLCSELENMTISVNYFNFIKDTFEDYIKYISNYKLITSDYIKKICQFQEKYGPRLTGKDKEKENQKYKNISTKHIYSITSPVIKIIDKQVENLKLLMDGIESQINNFYALIKEKEILLNKFTSMFDEATKDLLKKYRDIDKLKDSFMENMANTEDTVSKYLKKNSTVTVDQMKSIISATKKLEKDYKSSISSTKFYEETFDALYISSIENIKKLTSETSDQMKDIVIDFIVLLKNNNKMQSSEIDIYLPVLTELNEVKKIEEIIESSYKNNNKLQHVKPIKYKLKIFQTNDNRGDSLSSNNIVSLEDGFEEMNVIKDENILSTFKTMKQNFELVEDNKMDLSTEEEKMKVQQLTDKVLSLEKKKSSKNNNPPTKEDVDKLNSLLDIHHNRVVFLQKLSEYRNKGKFEIKQQTFDILSRLFNTIINIIERDNDFHSIKNAIILSQTYYVKTDDKDGKRYLQKDIQDNKIFKSKKFWEEFLDYNINKEIATCLRFDYTSGNVMKENKKESDDKISNIAFSQILPYTDNMIEFGLDKKIIREVVFPKMTLYKMSDELINSIKAVIGNE